MLYPLSNPFASLPDLQYVAVSHSVMFQHMVHAPVSFTRVPESASCRSVSLTSISWPHSSHSVSHIGDPGSGFKTFFSLFNAPRSGSHPTLSPTSNSWCKSCHSASLTGISVPGFWPFVAQTNVVIWPQGLFSNHWCSQIWLLSLFLSQVFLVLNPASLSHTLAFLDLPPKSVDHILVFLDLAPAPLSLMDCPVWLCLTHGKAWVWSIRKESDFALVEQVSIVAFTKKNKITDPVQTIQYFLFLVQP